MNEQGTQIHNVSSSNVQSKCYVGDADFGWSIGLRVQMKVAVT